MTITPTHLPDALLAALDAWQREAGPDHALVVDWLSHDSQALDLFLALFEHGWLKHQPYEHLTFVDEDGQYQRVPAVSRLFFTNKTHVALASYRQRHRRNLSPHGPKPSHS